LELPTLVFFDEFKERALLVFLLFSVKILALTDFELFLAEELLTLDCEVDLLE
jgi:hypothetical protein